MAAFSPERPFPAQGAESAAITSLREQLPEQLPDGVVMLLRRGPFYEAFGVDAGLVSRALNQPWATVQFKDGPAAMFSIPASKGRVLARKIAARAGAPVVLVNAYKGGTITPHGTTIVE